MEARNADTFKAQIDTTKPFPVRWLYRWANPPENKVPATYRILTTEATVEFSGGIGQFATFYSKESGRYLFALRLDYREWEVKDGVLFVEESQFGKAEYKEILEYEQFKPLVKNS